MDIAAYRRLLAQARRLTRRADEAEDLVQDTLLAALEAGRHDPAWLSGVLRNLAAMSGRTAARRRRREAAVADAMPGEAAPSDAAAGNDCESAARAWLLERLPPSARRVAVLALHGLSADEIRWILGIEATAFRQRLTRIRRALAELPADRRAEVAALAQLRDPARSADLPFGRIRRVLKTALRDADGIGAHDGDGHLLVLRPRAHVRSAGGN